VNIEFLIIALIIGKSVDWILQTRHQAENKTTSFKVLFEHSLTYALYTTSIPVLIVGITNLFIIIYLFVMLLITHILIDDRRLVKYIMSKKEIKPEDMSKSFLWLQIGIDQRLHELVILVMALSI